MAKNTVPVFTTGITTAGTVFNNSSGTSDATGTNAIQVAAGGANDSRLYKVNLASNDTSARDMVFYLYNGTTKFMIGAVSVPAGAGNSSAAVSVDFLASATIPLSNDQNGNPFMRLPNGWYLYAAPGSTITSGKIITVICTTEDF